MAANDARARHVLEACRRLRLRVPEDVAVIGVPHERWGETGQAVIVLKEGESLSEEAVLKHCKDKLARFKQPSSVRFIDEIPHNATGKQLKRELREQ